MSTELLIVAMIGFASQLTAACVAALFAWIAARKLATDLARNTAITEDTRRAVSELERPYARPFSGDWAAPHAD
jgi:hypothetical protein